MKATLATSLLRVGARPKMRPTFCASNGVFTVTATKGDRGPTPLTQSTAIVSRTIAQSERDAGGGAALEAGLQPQPRVARVER